MIGTIELGGLTMSQLHVSGGFWSWFEGIDTGTLGFVIAGMFIATWMLALAIWRFGLIEERWRPARSP